MQERGVAKHRAVRAENAPGTAKAPGGTSVGLIVSEAQRLQGLLHVLWQGRRPHQRLAGERVREGQTPGMKSLAAHAAQRCASVKAIGQQGVADVGHVDPDLVGPAGVQDAPHQTSLLVLVQALESGSPTAHREAETAKAHRG